VQEADGGFARGAYEASAPTQPQENAMPRKRTIKLRCPICKKQVQNSAPEFPFCSPRCRTIDLGKWASGGYVVSSPVTDSEETLQDSEQDRNQEE
jgi:uncharacterized protein